MSDRSLVLGTRGSALALWQAGHIRSRLLQAGFEVEVSVTTTTGDRRLDVPLSEIGEKGLFTKELDAALVAGEIQLAVHSLKDLPSSLPDEIVLAAVADRDTAADAFVAHPEFVGGLLDLPHGGIVATSSLRRHAQLKAWRPDLQIVSVRGNVDTRLQKLDESAWQGMILAEAGLRRLNLEGRVRQAVPHEIMLPAVGQGALAVVCLADRPDLRTTLSSVLDDPDARAAITAERAFLRHLEGGCTVPVAGFGVVRRDSVTLEGCVADLDGRRVFRDRIDGDVSEAERIGIELAEELLARGAGDVLAAVRK